MTQYLFWPSFTSRLFVSVTQYIGQKMLLQNLSDLLNRKTRTQDRFVVFSIRSQTHSSFNPQVSRSQNHTNWLPRGTNSGSESISTSNLPILYSKWYLLQLTSLMSSCKPSKFCISLEQAEKVLELMFSTQTVAASCLSPSTVCSAVTKMCGEVISVD